MNSQKAIREKNGLPAPGSDLYHRVRAGFVAKQESLNRWCLLNKINRENARAALLGLWNGEKAKALRQRLIEASGVGQ